MEVLSGPMRSNGRIWDMSPFASASSSASSEEVFMTVPSSICCLTRFLRSRREEERDRLDSRACSRLSFLSRASCFSCCCMVRCWGCSCCVCSDRCSSLGCSVYFFRPDSLKDIAFRCPRFAVVFCFDLFDFPSSSLLLFLLPVPRLLLLVLLVLLLFRLLDTLVFFLLRQAIQ